MVHRTIALTVLLLMLVALPLSALTDHEIAMFKRLEEKWEQSYHTLLSERASVPVDDSRYTELSKQLARAQYWSSYYREGQVDRSSWLTIIGNTIVWTATDLVEIAGIMWEQNDDLLEKIFTGKWADLMKDTVDSLMRQKIRSAMRDTFGGASHGEIEDHIFDRFIAPKLDLSSIQQLADKSFAMAKDGLKDAYVTEVKRQAQHLGRDELQALGGELAQRVGGAVDAAEFTIDMAQKYVMWNEAQPTIAAMLSHIQQIALREECSHLRAFAIYLGKEELSVAIEHEPVVTTSETHADRSPELVTTAKPIVATGPTMVEQPPHGSEVAALYASYRFLTAQEAIASHIPPEYSVFVQECEELYFDARNSFIGTVTYVDERRTTIDEITIPFGTDDSPGGSGWFWYLFGDSPDGRAMWQERKREGEHELAVRHDNGLMASYHLIFDDPSYSSTSYTWDAYGMLITDEDYWEHQDNEPWW